MTLDTCKSHPRELLPLAAACLYLLITDPLATMHRRVPFICILMFHWTGGNTGVVGGGESRRMCGCGLMPRTQHQTHLTSSLTTNPLTWLSIPNTWKRRERKHHKCQLPRTKSHPSDAWLCNNSLLIAQSSPFLSGLHPFICTQKHALNQGHGGPGIINLCSSAGLL